MKKNTGIIILGLAFLAFLFFKTSSSSTTTFSKTAGITPATSSAIQSVINGLVNIFGSKNSTSTYSGGGSWA